MFFLFWERNKLSVNATNCDEVIAFVFFIYLSSRIMETATI